MTTCVINSGNFNPLTFAAIFADNDPSHAEFVTAFEFQNIDLQYFQPSQYASLASHLSRASSALTFVTCDSVEIFLGRLFFVIRSMEWPTTVKINVAFVVRDIAGWSDLVADSSSLVMVQWASPVLLLDEVNIQSAAVLFSAEIPALNVQFHQLNLNVVTPEQVQAMLLPLADQHSMEVTFDSCSNLEGIIRKILPYVESVVPGQLRLRITGEYVALYRSLPEQFQTSNIAWAIPELGVVTSPPSLRRRAAVTVDDVDALTKRLASSAIGRPKTLLHIPVGAQRASIQASPTAVVSPVVPSLADYTTGSLMEGGGGSLAARLGVQVSAPRKKRPPGGVRKYHSRARERSFALSGEALCEAARIANVIKLEQALNNNQAVKGVLRDVRGLAQQLEEKAYVSIVVNMREYTLKVNNFASVAATASYADIISTCL
tara:strand:+ start:79233 stop:80528 length:1296 start_codon:yes stop_codon:yes gene_type:complete